MIDMEGFGEYNDKYEFVDELYKENETLPVRLLDKYEGTIIQYGAVSCKEVDGDEAVLSFDIDIVENPHDIKKSDVRFQQHAGGILVNIIINSINMKEAYEDRNADTESADTQ